MENNLSLVIIAIPVLALSIAFHEMMHAFVSDRLGDDTARLQGRISLNPFKHIDPFLTIGLPLVLILLGLPPFGAARPVPMNPSKIKYDEFGVAIVAIAGPLANLLLAIVAALILRNITLDTGNIAIQALILMLQINIGFLIFNLIPFPPLDGSRVLYAFAPEALQRIMLQIESTGFMAIAIFMFLIFPFLGRLMDYLYNLVLTVLI